MRAISIVETETWVQDRNQPECDEVVEEHFAGAGSPLLVVFGAKR